MKSANPATFFWCWLSAATAASVVGNVTHAVLSAPPAPIIAAGAAIVPPAVQLCATHGVAVLVRSTRTSGAAYRAALVMTVGLAVCAFILSFGALRDLAENWAGYPPAVAWLWPIAIDLSVALSTVALLSLGSAGRDVDAPPVQLRSVDALDDAPAEQDRASGVLAALAGGTPPSTVARRFGMGYATVLRIRAGASGDAAA